MYLSLIAITVIVKDYTVIEFQFIFNSLYDERYVRSAFFFKTMEGFLEAGPQLALQVNMKFQRLDTSPNIRRITKPTIML